MSDEIFKVQVPLSTNTQPQAFVYNFTRSKEFLLPVTPELLEFMNGAPKKFAYAHVEEPNLVIDSEAPWQDW